MLNQLKPSLMFIEDDSIVRDILCSFIKAKYPDLPIYSGDTAEEGMALFREHRPPIVLTDINLSGSDGVGMVRSIRLIAPETVIFFVTGSSHLDRLAEFSDSGPCHVIIKPVNCYDLITLLDRYIKTDIEA